MHSLIAKSFLICVAEDDSNAINFSRWAIIYLNSLYNHEGVSRPYWAKLKYLRSHLATLKSKELKIKEADPYKVNEDFVEYPYFAHGYEGTMRFWEAAMKYEGTKRLKELFEIKH